MEIDKKIGKINATLGQGFMLKIGDYISSGKKTPRLVRNVSDGFVCIDLCFDESKGNGGMCEYTPVAVMRRYKESSNGFDACKINGKDSVSVAVGKSQEEPFFDILRAMTFTVNVASLIEKAMYGF